MFIVFIFLSYLIGSIPFGYLISKSKKIDIRSEGSGNIGATNILRSLGIKYAIIVGVLDLLKGAIPVLFVSFFYSNELIIALAAGAAVVGNVFPIFLRFKGGKGVSTYAGTLLIILGVDLFIIAAILWLTYLYISRIMSLTNLIACLILPAIFLFIINSNTYFIYSLLLAALIWYNHRENIKRIMENKENKLSFRH